MNAGTILTQFYDAVRARDMAKARTYLADDMTFEGLFETYPNADAYIATFTQLMSIVSRLDVKTVVGDGDQAAIFMMMETMAPAPGTTLVAEWHQTRNGKIVRAQSAFDGRPFAAMFTPPQDTAADERAIRALGDQFIAALLGGDATMRASLWTEDGSVVPPQGGFHQGRAAMAAHFETERGSVTHESQASFTDYRFRFIHRDAAHVDCVLELRHVLGPHGKVAPLVRVSVAFTAVRQGDRWLIQDERTYFLPPTTSQESSMPDILHRVGIAATPERVFAALTTLPGLRGWWISTATGEPATGGVVDFGFCNMQVVAAEPNTLVHWRCVRGPGEWVDTEVTFRLRKEDGQTVVVFKHANWKEPVEFMHHCSTKWATFLLSLRDSLESAGGRPAPHDLKIHPGD